ncbi:Replication factor C subunit 1 [Vitis vinifera]|uniref:Replication factor C subunit 1 n=1 Tax=Vitis vinifera TaxID=29760 RepID=A0A438BNZ6_VITVI|nr:Replication factor C subunit 1 [Vitis vinifera]
MIAQEDLMDLGIIPFKRMGKEDLKELGSLACLFFHISPFGGERGASGHYDALTDVHCAGTISRLKGFGIWSNEALLAEVACYKGGKFASAKARSSTVLMGVENWPLMMCFVSGDLLLSVGAEGGEECYGVGNEEEEGLEGRSFVPVLEIALEELAERVNGDMRMALNQLQYMSLSMSVIKYDDVRQRLLSSAKDEDISPFVAVDKLFGFNGGKLRMDERIDLSMSDPDLVPLLIQENYINYRPTLAGKDDNGVKRMSLLARAAESIGDGDIINVQIRRYRQWATLSSWLLCILAALLHGQRETLEQLNINGSSRGNTGKEGPGGNHKVGREAYGSSLWKAISKGGD